ncbi:hypothetical protein FACS1894122_07070 [Alphaproteobacteria bacterium]|nr:hypothetical protein FACS1894122_07070 [Alphaproteobacteria bacterium]
MTVAEYKDVLKQLFRGVVGDTLSMVNLLLNSPLAERAINRYLGQDCTSLQELSSNIKCSTNWHNTGSHVKEMKVNLLTVMLVKAGMMNGNFSYTGGCI